MKILLKTFSFVLVIVITATVALLLFQEEKECCLCNSFRYHAPCIIDLKTGDLLELDLYVPHQTLVAELAEIQPETSTCSFVHIGNVSGIKLTDSRTATVHIPDDKTHNPALCCDCRKQLPLGYTSRYVFADLYKKDEKMLIPIKEDVTFSFRCYNITTKGNTATSNISVIIQGIR